MARGTIYGIYRNRVDAGSFNPGDVIDYTGFEFDYVGDEDCPESIGLLLRNLEGFGAAVRKESDCWSVRLSDDVKRNYFRERLELLKKRVAEISLDEFSTTDPYKLRWLVDDTYSDAIYSNEDGFRTLDQWIRSAWTDETYYLMHAYSMH